MKAICWYGANDVRLERVPEPTLLNPKDAILKITSATICGSDLHIYDGYIATIYISSTSSIKFETVFVNVSVKKKFHSW